MNFLYVFVYADSYNKQAPKYEAINAVMFMICMLNFLYNKKFNVDYLGIKQSWSFVECYEKVLPH